MPYCGIRAESLRNLSVPTPGLSLAYRLAALPPKPFPRCSPSTAQLQPKQISARAQALLYALARRLARYRRDQIDSQQEYNDDGHHLDQGSVRHPALQWLGWRVCPHRLGGNHKRSSETGFHAPFPPVWRWDQG